MDANSGPPPSHGRLSVTRGALEAVRPRWEQLARNAWFTRKIALLLPVGDAKADAEFLAALQVQRYVREFNDVPIAALGDEDFRVGAQVREAVCLSRGRGLHADAVLGTVPAGDLVLAIDGPTFQRLGVEEPAPGAIELQKLARLALPGGRRHVRVGLGVSKTRARRAASAGARVGRVGSTGAYPGALSRWRSIAHSEDRCELTLYCGQEPQEERCDQGLRWASALSETPASLTAVLAATRRVSVSLPGTPVLPTSSSGASKLFSSGLGAGTVQRWFEDLTAGSECSASCYGEACEDFLDWLGMLHISAPEFPQRRTSALSDAETAWMWTLGESLMGPAQVMHATDACLRAVATCAYPWLIVSIWSDEDAPLSYHGGAHGYDAGGGACHSHLLVVGNGDAAVAPKAVLLEAANVLHSYATK